MAAAEDDEGETAAEREARQAAEEEGGRERAEQSALETELQKTEKLIVTVSQTLSQDGRRRTATFQQPAEDEPDMPDSADSDAEETDAQQLVRKGASLEAGGKRR